MKPFFFFIQKFKFDMAWNKETPDMSINEKLSQVLDMWNVASEHLIKHLESIPIDY